MSPNIFVQAMLGVHEGYLFIFRVTILGSNTIAFTACNSDFGFTIPLGFIHSCVHRIHPKARTSACNCIYTHLD